MELIPPEVQLKPLGSEHNLHPTVEAVEQSENHNMNGRRLWSVILILTSQLGIGLHQGLLTDGILDLHLRLSNYINA